MKHKTLRTLLCVILTVCFCLSAIAPVSAAGLFGGDTGAASIFDEWIRSLKDRFMEKNPGTDETPAEQTATGDNFIRIFHLDCGRRYFSVDEIEGIIDTLKAKKYTHIELAFGNDGLRFLLDDMSVGDYTSEQVKSAIQSGNREYYSNGQNELSETEMNEIIAYANDRSIGVIPLINMPGHSNVLITAMAQLFGVQRNSLYTYENDNGGQAFKILKNEKAVTFAKELAKKYVDYFSAKGSAYFNIGADECGYTTSGSDYSFENTIAADLLNPMAEYIVGKEMKPMMFNDGFNTNDALQNALTANTYGSKFTICYWDYSNRTTADDLNQAGFGIINTHNKWYYVAGKENNEWFGYDWAKNNLNGEYKNCSVCDSGFTQPNGCMLAYWCDKPTDAKAPKLDRVKELIGILSDNNKEKFTGNLSMPAKPAISGVPTSVQISDGTVNVSSSIAARWTSSNNSVITFEDAATKAAADSASYTKTATARIVGAGTAIITATTANRGWSVQTVTVTNNGGTVDPGTEYDDRNVTVNKGQELVLPVTISGKYDTTVENEYAKVVAASREIPGETTYERTTLAEGDFYISTSASASAPTVKITLEDAGNGQYYLKNASGQYVYPDATCSYSYDWGGSVSWIYKLSNGKEAVTIDENNGAITIYRDVEGTYQDWWGYTNYASTKAYIRLSNNSSLSYSETSQNLYLYEQNTTPAGYETVVTVTGKKVTTAPVEMIVGTVKYLITVTAEDLSGVTPLAVQTWQTNIIVETGTAYGNKRTTGTFGGWENENQNPYYVEITADSVYGEAGKKIDTLFPNSISRSEWGGRYYVNNKHDTKSYRELVVWEGRIHNSQQIQTIGGVDYSNTGTPFTHIRYWKGNFQVTSTPDVENSWVTVTGTGCTGSSASCTQQLVVYYMMRTEVTAEVTTDVADWGHSDKSEYDEAENKGQYVVLDYAVKYPDGTRNPEGFPVTGKTFVFHCDESKANNTGSPVKSIYSDGTTKYYRQLNNFRAVENLNGYEVYMVTVTMTNGNLTSGTTAYDLKSTITYDSTTEQIVWAIDEEARDNSGLNPYTSISGANSDYSGCTIGGEPYVRGVEVYEKNGALITYYIRAKYSVDNLKVHYIIKDTNNEFYNYDIAVKSGTTFDANISLANPWKGPLAYGSVKNNLDVTQTVSADLSTMPAISAQYRYVDYTCVEVKRSEDGKEVFLYYTFDADVSFVVDFGLPLTIPYAALNENLSNPSVKITKITKGTAKYGTLSVNGTESITYTPKQTIDTNDSFNVTCTGTIPVQDKTTGQTTYQQGEVTYTVYIIPATNVYYEESFMTPSGSNSWGTSTTPTTKQTTELGGAKTYVYGYEQELVKGNTTNYSGNSAYVANLNLPADKKSVYTKDNLTFSFTGAGFDLISECGKDTGMVVVRLENAKTKEAKVYIIDTYFHGDDTILNNTHNIYQTPVIRELALVYGTYNVTIRGALYKNSGTVVNQPAAADVSTYSMQASAFAVETETFDIRAFLDDCGFEDVSVDDVELVYMDENSVLNGGAGIQSEAAAPVERSAAFSTYAMNAETEAASSTEARVTIDGFRVYNPLKDGSDVYTTDNESGVKYNDLSKYIQSNSTTGALPTETKNVMYVEYNSELKQAECANYNSKPFGTNGPKYEIYLAPNCGIAVGLPNDFTEKDILQLSAKIVSGTPTLKIGKNDGSFKIITVGNQNAGLSLTGTEMYYDISDCIQQTTDGKKFITIINGTSAGEQKGSQSVLAVNVLKMSENKATNEMSEETQNYILASLTESMATPIDDTFEPEVFEVYAPTTARRNRTFSISAYVSVTDLEKVTIAADDGTETELNALNRVSVKWGISSEYYYLKTFRMRDSGEHTFKITAYGKDGSSVSKTVTVLVK